MDIAGGQGWPLGCGERGWGQVMGDGSEGGPRLSKGQGECWVWDRGLGTFMLCPCPGRDITGLVAGIKEAQGAPGSPI